MPTPAPERALDIAMLREYVFREGVPDPLVAHAADIINEDDDKRYRLLSTRFFRRLEKFLADLE